MSGMYLPSARGTVTQANMKISAVDGTAFVDFTASTVVDSIPVVAATAVTQANTRIATVATGALLELVGVDLSAHLGKFIRIRSNGLRLEGYIGAAGGEALSSLTINNADFASDEPPGTAWTRGTGITISGGKLNFATSTRVTASQSGILAASAAATIGKLYKVGITIDAISVGSIGLRQGGGLVRDTFTTTGIKTSYFTGYSPVGSTSLVVDGMVVATTATLDAIVVSQVTDLATTGAKIYTTSGGATQSWSYQDATFDPNYSGGVTYEIYSVTPLINHLGHLLKVRDSAGKAIQGFVKAAGTGETAVTDVLAGWNFTSGFTTNNATVNDANTFTNTGSVGYVQKDFFTIGQLLKITFDSAQTTGVTTLRHTTAIQLAADGDSNVYKTAESTNARIRNTLSGAVVDVNTMTAYAVTTPSATGATITTLKGGTTYNFAQKDAAFNYNDPSGYTYELYKVLDAPVVATGSITAGNAHLSLVDGGGTAPGGAFADLQGVDLSPFANGKHILALHNTTGGYAAIGFLKAAGGGESFGSEITTGTCVIRTLYKINATEANHYGTGLGVNAYFTSNGTETNDANNKVKQVLVPSVTGSTITNTAGGTTYNWLYKHASFDPNGAMTYKVLYIGD
jgi:hypothetical protein